MARPFSLADAEADRLSPEFARLRAQVYRPRAEREPCATYQQALWRLVVEKLRGAPSDGLAVASSIVADLFWVTDDQLHRDLAKLEKEVS